MSEIDTAYAAIDEAAKEVARLRAVNASLAEALRKALRRLEEEFSHFAPGEPENRLIKQCRDALAAAQPKE